MIKRLLWLIIISLTFAAPAFAQEVIDGFQEKDKPVLNEELRKLSIDEQIKLASYLDMRSKRITSLATPTASTDAATKAYVDAQTFTLTTYDTGWFAIVDGGSYTKTHNLGLADPLNLVFKVYVATDTNGTSARTASEAVSASGSYGVTVEGFATNSFEVQIGGAGICALDANGTFDTTSYDTVRVVAISLE